MVFELVKAVDKFDFDRKGVHVNSIDFENNNKMITVRCGKELITDQDINQVTTALPNTQFMVHVSTSDKEYIFCLYKYSTGLVGITRYQTGDTNEYVYVFEGIRGQILEVEYAVKMDPKVWDPGKGYFIPVTETFGQIYIGYYRRSEDSGSTLPPGAVFGTFIRTSSVIALEETSEGALSSIVPTTLELTDGFNDSYFNPFLDSSTTTSGMKRAFYNKYFGGGMIAFKKWQGQAVNEGKWFVGKWI